MTGAIDYSAPGRLTDIGEVSVAVLEAIPADPVGICRLVPGLVLHPFEATDLGLDAGRLGGREIRLASAIIRAVLALDPAALDPAALDIPREPERRLVGTCRTFDEAALHRATVAPGNPGCIDVELHSCRYRLGFAPDHPPYEEIEQRLAVLPAIAVPAVIPGGMADANFPAADQQPVQPPPDSRRSS